VLKEKARRLSGGLVDFCFSVFQESARRRTMAMMVVMARDVGRQHEDSG